MRNHVPSIKQRSQQEDGIRLVSGASDERTPPAAEVRVVWELRSPTTSATVRCVIEEYAGGHCRIRVTYADDEVMSVWQASPGDATAHAAAIESNLLHIGWGNTAT
jgi:hypothetical protein